MSVPSALPPIQAICGFVSALTYAAIVNALTNPQIACIGGNADGTDMSSATEAVVTGTYNGQLLVIQVNWSSSYTGLQSITAGTWSMKWLSTANISSSGTPVYATVNGSSITGYTAISIGSQIYDSPASGPNVSLAD